MQKILDHCNFWLPWYFPKFPQNCLFSEVKDHLTRKCSQNVSWSSCLLLSKKSLGFCPFWCRKYMCYVFITFRLNKSSFSFFAFASRYIFNLCFGIFQACRLCSDCGSRTPGGGQSSRWHAHYTVCDSCYQQRNKGFSCPLCRRAYRAAAVREMVQCSKCHK